MRRKARQILPVVVACLAVAVMRMQLIERIPLFVDEALYCHLGSEFGSSGFSQTWDKTVNQWKVAPLASMVMGMWFKVWPEAKPISACRNVSVMAGVVTGVMVYLLACELTSRKEVQWGAVGFYLLNPFSFFAERTSLQEPMLVMMMTLSVWLIMRARRKKRIYEAVGAMMVLVLAFLIKLNALIIVPPVLALIARAKQKKLKYAYWGGLITVVAGFIVWSKSTTGLWETVGYHTTRQVDIGSVTQKAWSNLRLARSWYGQYLGHFFWVGLMLGSIELVKKKRYIWVGFWVSMLAGYAVVVDGFFPRYLLITLPFVAIVLGYSSRSMLGKIVLVLMLVGYGFADFKIVSQPALAQIAREDKYQFFEDWTSGTGVEAAVKFLASREEVVEVVLSTDLEYRFRLYEQQLYKQPQFEIYAVRDGDNFEAMSSQLDTSRAVVAATQHDQWLVEAVAENFEMRRIAATHGQEAKSVATYEFVDLKDQW